MRQAALCRCVHVNWRPVSPTLLNLKTGINLALLSNYQAISLRSLLQRQDDPSAAEGLPDTKVVLLQIPASAEHPGLQVSHASPQSQQWQCIRCRTPACV